MRRRERSFNSGKNNIIRKSLFGDYQITKYQWMLKLKVKVGEKQDFT